MKCDTRTVKTAVRNLLVGSGLKNKLHARKLEKLLAEGIPPELHEGLRFLLNGETDRDTVGLADAIERMRDSIAAQGHKSVEILYSPKPGSSGDKVAYDLKPKPGKVLRFTMAQIARTGKDRRWGTFLYLVAKNTGARTVLELGSCAGMSGCYLAAADSLETFITVEGSPLLAQMAEDNIQKIAPHAIVVNSLFDDAIDQQLPKLRSKLDYVFIDGHHERTATIHYYERVFSYLNTRAVVVFDDISWSQDMREAWNELCLRREFSHVLDLGALGVCVVDLSLRHAKPRYWDLQVVLGRRPIGDPHGWKE